MIVGIDLGGMSAKVACLTDDGKLAGKSSVPLSAEMGAEAVADALAGLAEAAAQRAGYCMADAEAIGIGSPGVIDGQNGVVVLWSNYGWKDVRLAELVSARTGGKRVFVVNDANAAALGEAKFGAGKNYSDCALITLGTGVGSGIVLGGKLFEGYRGAGTEFGHTVIRSNGEKCTCGRRGCLERYTSAAALVRFTEKAMKQEPDSLMRNFLSDGKADGRTVFLAARAGDAAAKRVLGKYIAYLGDGIVNLVNLLRPQAVLLGGGISNEGENLLAPLREYVYPRLYVSADYAPLALLCATLKNDAGIYGAAEYAREGIAE